MNDDFSYLDEMSHEEVQSFKAGEDVFHDGRDQLQGAADMPTGLEEGLGGGSPGRRTIGDPNAPYTIVAEGDSWFDLPLRTDLIVCLKRMGHSIFSRAKAGDTLENMIFGSSVTRSFGATPSGMSEVLGVLRKEQTPVFLFSGGGNDVAGDALTSYLNHSESGLPAFRQDYAESIIDNVFRKYLESMISQVSRASANTHIFMHGYGYVMPTGKGYELASFTFAGPWLLPALAAKRVFDPTEQQTILRFLIDRYNGLLQTLDNENPNFHYVNLRDLINPETDWSDELHVKNSVYAKAAQRIDQHIRREVG